MSNWKIVLKNQKTFQSLGIGEIDLESSVESEERRCKPIVLRHIERIKQLEKDYIEKFGKHFIDTFNGVRTPFTNNIYTLSQSPYASINFMIRSEDFGEDIACDFLENLPKKGFSHSVAGFGTQHVFGHDMPFDTSPQICAFLLIQGKGLDKSMLDEMVDMAKKAFGQVFKEV